MVFAFYLYFFV